MHLVCSTYRCRHRKLHCQHAQCFVRPERQPLNLVASGSNCGCHGCLSYQFVNNDDIMRRCVIVVRNPWSVCMPDVRGWQRGNSPRARSINLKKGILGRPVSRFLLYGPCCLPTSPFVFHYCNRRSRWDGYSVSIHSYFALHLFAFLSGLHVVFIDPRFAWRNAWFIERWVIMQTSFR